MKRLLVCGLATIIFGLPICGLAAEAAYKAPRNGFGQPDLGGSWSNATLTPQVRPALYGARRTQTPEEVKLLEGANAAKDAASAAPVTTASGGAASDNVGAYDRAWIDQGAKVMRVEGEPRTSLITTADGQPPPHRGEAATPPPPGAGSVEAGRQAVKQAAEFDQFAAQGNVAIGRMGSFDNPESRGVGERCIIGFGRNAGPPMFPNGWYNNNYLFAQGEDEIGIVVEMNHDVRHIRLVSGTLAGAHRKDEVRPWFGDSVGRWEGDTLVVETDHFPETQAYYGAWKDLKVTERFTRVGQDRLAYRFTVEAPSVWDRPWGGEYEFHPLKAQLFEYACHEGNYALPGILAGARAEERRAAAQPTEKVAGQ
ncbi:MAG: hypothetical protein JWO33_1606 [Caulobacteraceae bacterium]|nr:hypothetical protein [Caulobacteraceae bacterium]